jgi:hypothetical protein
MPDFPASLVERRRHFPDDACAAWPVAARRADPAWLLRAKLRRAMAAARHDNPSANTHQQKTMRTGLRDRPAISSIKATFFPRSPSLNLSL